MDSIQELEAEWRDNGTAAGKALEKNHRLTRELSELQRRIQGGARDKDLLAKADRLSDEITRTRKAQVDFVHASRVVGGDLNVARKSRTAQIKTSRTMYFKANYPAAEKALRAAAIEVAALASLVDGRAQPTAAMVSVRSVSEGDVHRRMIEMHRETDG